MKNTFGNNVSLTLFGESHGEYIGAVLDGLAPGIEIDKAYIESNGIGIMGLGIKKDQAVTFTIEGEDEELACEAIENFMRANL